jgi:CRP-like cAMP-binding protein
MTPVDKLATLRSVSLFSALTEATLIEIAKRADVKHYVANRRIVSELEFGNDVYVLARGRAEVSVCPPIGERQLLGEIGPGTIFGEMASLTGELRSATVITLMPVDVLVLSDQVFDELRTYRPEIAISLMRTMANRLTETERTLSTLLSNDAATTYERRAKTHHSTITVLWRELVVNHQKDLAFLTLSAFVLTILLIRFAVFLVFAYDYAPLAILRTAYVSGFALVIFSAGAALLTFRPKWRRGVAIAFGIGAALIVNELGVTLAFDIFYKDIFTPDPSLSFDIERLYRRTEPFRAAVVVLSLLFQAVYLRMFYVRLWRLFKIRILRLLRGQ